MVKRYRAMSPHKKLITNLCVLSIIFIAVIALITVAAASTVVFSNRTPSAGSIIAENRPTVAVNVYDDGSLDMGTATLLLNGSPVGSLSGTAPDFTLSYTPGTPLGDGLYTVAASVRASDGRVFDTSWSFTVGIGPSLSNFAPAQGANLTNINPKISFAAADPNEINAGAVVVKVNGQTLPVTVSFKEIGHWESDACASNPPVWVIDGYDYTQAVITASTSNLPDINNVWVSVSDKLGNTTAREWSFTCMIAPVISNLTPANNTGVNTPFPTISAKVTDNGTINAQSIILKVNTSVVPHTFNPLTGEILHVPTTPLNEGVYNIYLEVSDSAGNKKTAAWKFTVGYDTTGPALGSLSPAPGSQLQITNPVVSFTANDINTINASSVQVIVNGRSFPAKVAFREVGHWETRYEACTDTTYTVWVVDYYDYTNATITAATSALPDYCDVSVRVADLLGNVTTAQWSFECKLAPSISTLLPANGSSVNTAMPTISAKVTDNGVVDAQSIVLKLGSQVLLHTFNAATGIVSFGVKEPLPAGTYTVSLEAKDTAGNTGTSTWNFNVPQGTASYSEALPVQGAQVLVVNPQIRIKVTGTVNLNQNTMYVYINGSRVNAAISFEEVGYWTEGYDSCSEQIVQVWVRTGYDYTKGTISFRPAVLPDGENKVAVSIADVNGKPSSIQWSFQVRVPPVISNASPANNTTVAVQTPQITAKVTDNGTIANVTMSVDGAVVPVAFNAATGVVSYTPHVLLSNGRDHFVTVTATDAVGTSASASWKFHVQIYPDMPVSSQCANCHEGYPSPNHPVSNCYGCHGNHQPIEDCADCHGNYTHGTEVLRVAYGHGGAWYPRCVDCHNTQYSYKIPMHAPDNAAYHSTTTEFEMCETCHSSSLTREHQRYKDAQGNTYTCFTCHKSTNAEVLGAIRDRQTNCEACHGADTHEAVHQATVFDRSCATCHIGTLTKEHLDNPITQVKTLNCSTCHFNNKKEVKRAISLKSIGCASCHKQAHRIAFADKVPGDIPLYSGFNWSTPLEADLFKGDASTPAGFEAGLVVLSNRRQDVTGEELWNYYLNSLTASGWVLGNAQEPGSSVCSAEFTYQNRKLVLRYYNTLRSNGTGREIGYRVELWYR